jgi:hypothetical protein
VAGGGLPVAESEAWVFAIALVVTFLPRTCRTVQEAWVGDSCLQMS